MVVSRSNRKLSNDTNTLKDSKVEKVNESVTENHVQPITIELDSSFDDDENKIEVKFDGLSPSNVLNDRPKRNIERTNYNQAKMMRDVYNKNRVKNVVNPDQNRRMSLRSERVVHSKMDKSVQVSVALEPISVVISSSSEGVSDNSIATLSDLNSPGTENSLRPRRNIGRTNYNQSKLFRDMYNKNRKSDSSDSGEKIKRQKPPPPLEKSMSKIVKPSPTVVNDKPTATTQSAIFVTVKEDKDSIIPNKALNINALLNKLSPFKKSLTKRITGSSATKRSRLISEELDEMKFAKISDRAFRYPWEWDSLNKVSSQAQILGYRTLSNGVCETLMCRR